MICNYNDEKKAIVESCSACGYSYGEHYTKNGYEPVEGDEPFIELGITTKKGKGYFSKVEETRLYACPKCGAVHIKL